MNEHKNDEWEKRRGQTESKALINVSMAKGQRESETECALGWVESAGCLDSGRF